VFVKFRRKSAEEVEWGEVKAEAVDDDAPDDLDDDLDDDDDGDEPPAAGPALGPHDAEGAPDDGYARVDLGSLLIPAADGLELRLQVDEATDEVRAALLTSNEGALELRAFAAPRNGDLWSEVRPKIAADFAQRGGTASAGEGPWGPELACQLTVNTPDGRTGTQPSRIIGINGSRWMLRATLLGRAAVDESQAHAWEEIIGRILVRRGDGAMPVGSELPLQVPAGGVMRGSDG
jgi:hypothetical protein